MPQLQRITLNLGDLLSTSDRPESAALKHFERLFDNLKQRAIDDIISHCNSKSFDLEVRKAKKSQMFEFPVRIGSFLCFNHVHLNPALKYPFTVQFSELAFDRPLVSCLFHNFVQNKLNVLCRPLVESAEYLDVLDSFYLLKAPECSGSVPFERIYGFHQFARHFPQIRKVKLNNCFRKSELQVDLFFQFLSEFQGLTTLEFYCSGFGNAECYDHLHELASLQTLNTLRIIEQCEEFNRQLDFRFLSKFTYLHEFATNLVTRQRAPDLIRMMKVKATFTFDFLHQKLGQKYHQVIVNRIDGWLYEVILVMLSLSESGLQEQRAVKYLKLFETINFLANQSLLETPHWLDDLPQDEIPQDDIPQYELLQDELLQDNLPPDYTTDKSDIRKRRVYYV